MLDNCKICGNPFDTDEFHNCPACIVEGESKPGKTEAKGSAVACCSDAKVAVNNGCWIAEERQQLLELTQLMDCHPEGYGGPCECQECQTC